jgi:sigma-B regulation protein RsbU (phosphoserine phosphatase)
MEETQTLKPQSPAPVASPAVAVANLLVVDDNASNRILLSRYLKLQGHTCVLANDGVQALELLHNQSFDLVLLDIEMPNMDGYQLLEQLKADASLRDIPVIMISALEELDSVVRCIELGAEDYLAKPFNPILLKARLNASLEKKRWRDREVEYLKQVTQRTEELAHAHNEISALNSRLKAENMRMSAELDVTRRLQQMILPKTNELKDRSGLDIASYMQSAQEVGGDYYDVLQAQDGQLLITIGDVTGHGLESGVLMMMVQTAIRTLHIAKLRDPLEVLNLLNQSIYANLERMDCDKIMTLLLTNYDDGLLTISGQHEMVLVIRNESSEVELIDTMDLGFPLGLQREISAYVGLRQLRLATGDVVVLYTDGVTEADNPVKDQYGLERLSAVAQANVHKNAEEIKTAIIEDLLGFIGPQKIYDDITLLVLKQR